MLIWFILGELIALGVAIYTASYALWAFRQKNNVGAVGLCVVALISLTTPIIVFFLNRV